MTATYAENGARRDCPIFGLFGTTRHSSPQVRGHLLVTADGSSTVRRTLSARMAGRFVWVEVR